MYQNTRFIVLSIVILVVLGYFLPYWRPEFWLARAELYRLEKRLSKENRPIRLSDLGKNVDYTLGDYVTQRLPEHSNEIQRNYLRYPIHALSDADAEAIQAFYIKHRESIDDICDVENPAQFRFRYDYATTNPSQLVLSWDKFERLSNFLSARFLLNLKQGKYLEAIADWCELIDLDQFLVSDPFVVTQMIRASNCHSTLNGLQMLLGATQVSDEQLERIESRLKLLGESLRLKPSIEAERCCGFTLIENLSVNKPRYGGNDSLEMNRRAGEWEKLRYLPFLMHEQVLMAELYDQLADCIDDVSFEGGRKYILVKQRFDEYDQNRPDSYFANNRLAFEDARKRVFRARRRVQAARLTVRALQFRNRVGRLPDNLTQLVRPDEMLIVTESDQLFEAKLNEAKLEVIATSEHDLEDDVEMPRGFVVELEWRL